MKTLVELLQPHVGTRLYGLPEFESNQRGFSGDGAQTGDHAGKVETSLLWALRPECVDVSRFPPAGSPDLPFAMGADARQADRRAGERMVQDQIEFLGRKTRELLAEYDRLRPAHNFTTFEQVEALWHALVVPEIPRFQSMQPRWDWTAELPTDSPWVKNAAIPKNWKP